MTVKQPDPHTADYQTWAVMHERVYQTDIHSVDEQKQRLIKFRCNLDRDIIDMATDKVVRQTSRQTSSCYCEGRSSPAHRVIPLAMTI